MRNRSVVLFLFLCLSGCGMYKVYYDYDVSVKNIGETKLRDVVITSDKGFWHSTGYLNGDATKTLAGLKSVPPNSVYTIVIERNNREEFENIVDLHDKVRKGFRGDIIFFVDDNNHVTYGLE